MELPLKCKSCGKTFPLAARISTEKNPSGHDFSSRRVIIEKPCCPFCESIDLEACE